LGVELVEVRHVLSSSSSDVLSLLKHAGYSKHVASLVASVPYTRRNISKSPLQIWKVSRKIWCLLSASVPLPSCNRKRAWTRGDQYGRCVNFNVYKATPLGILSGDVPCSLSQRPHSCTAIGWCSTEPVLELFDTHSYVKQRTRWASSKVRDWDVCIAIALKSSMAKSVTTVYFFVLKTKHTVCSSVPWIWLWAWSYGTVFRYYRYQWPMYAKDNCVIQTF
jgi:hypothetical protein